VAEWNWRAAASARHRTRDVRLHLLAFFQLREPIAIGIGIHGGEVIIGDIGFRDHTVFTALGDPVNVAARPQDLTKTLDCKVVVSEEVCSTAGIVPDALAPTQVPIRGRDEPMMVRTAADPAVFAGLLEMAQGSGRR
jgi:adenylate cyclase